MTQRNLLAERYRIRARKLRALVATGEYTETSEALWIVAKRYERMALIVEAMDHRDATLKRSA